MVTIAFVIAVAMKVVGVLLIVSMLIIPAAVARRFAATPERMAAMAALAVITSYSIHYTKLYDIVLSVATEVSIGFTS